MIFYIYSFPAMANCAFPLGASPEWDPELFSKHFTRSSLSPYFDRNLEEVVTLYRGLPEENFSPTHLGEDFLIYTSFSLEDAISYASQFADSLRRGGRRRVLVLKLKVPKSLVYKKSSWPVLRLEDVPHLGTYLEAVGVIKLTRSLSDFVARHPGEDELLMGFFRRTQPLFLEGAGRNWQNPSRWNYLP